MKEYAECFRNNLKPNQCGMSIPKEEGVERINVVIFGLKNTTMIPYILYIAKNVQDKNELNKMYGILESYIMRRVVVHASTKSYNNLFTSLILNKVLDSQTLTLRLKGIGDATTYCPDDNEMKIGFETSKLVNLQSKGIIYLLESKIRSDNSSTVLLATVYKGNIIKNLIMDCQSYTKYRPNETTGGIFVSWRRKEELPTGA